MLTSVAQCCTTFCMSNPKPSRIIAVRLDDAAVRVLDELLTQQRERFPTFRNTYASVIRMLIVEKAKAKGKAA